MNFRLVPKSVTLNDIERSNGRYIAFFLSEFGKPVFQKSNRVDLWRNVGLYTSLLYFVLRVRCRCKESSRSLYVVVRPSVCRLFVCRL